jgi:hypothetical protein
MPCYSIFETSIQNAATLVDALKRLGAEVQVDGSTIVAKFKTETLTYTKQYGGAYGVNKNSNMHKLVAKKYAAMTVSAWARSKGFQVQGSPTNPNKIELRRG